MLFSQPAGLQRSGNDAVLPFSKLSIKGNVDVVLYQSGKEDVEIPRGLVGKVIIENMGDALLIDAENNHVPKGVPVVIRYKQLSGLAVNGNGHVVCDTDIKSSQFDLVCKGNAGWVKLTNIYVGHINISIIGNKNLELAGTARSKNFNIQGGGLHLFRLSTK